MSGEERPVLCHLLVFMGRLGGSARGGPCGTASATTSVVGTTTVQNTAPELSLPRSTLAHSQRSVPQAENEAEERGSCSARDHRRCFDTAAPLALLRTDTEPQRMPSPSYMELAQKPPRSLLLTSEKRGQWGLDELGSN